MFAEPSARTRELLDRLNAFFDQHIYPNEARHHEELHARRKLGTELIQTVRGVGYTVQRVMQPL